MLTLAINVVSGSRPNPPLHPQPVFGVNHYDLMAFFKNYKVAFG